MRLVLSRAALDDLVRLRDFLIRANPTAAQRAVSAISMAIDTLVSLPERGKPIGNVGLRELIVPFGRSAYVVRFLPDRKRGEIVIVRVWHSREARE